MENYFTERKAEIMGMIRQSKADIELYNKCLKKFGKEWRETLELEKENFDFLLDELINLKKEQNERNNSNTDV